MVNKSKVIEKLKKLEANASEPVQLMNIGTQIIEELDDREWAAQVYRNSIKLSKTCYDPIGARVGIALTIAKQLDDFEWANSLVEEELSDSTLKAKKRLECIWFYTNFPGNDVFIAKANDLYSDFLNLSADFTSDDLYQSASVIFNDLNNSDLAIKYLQEAEKRAESPWDFIFIAKEYANMTDKKNAQRLADIGLSKCDDKDELDSLKSDVDDFMTG